MSIAHTSVDMPASAWVHASILTRFRLRMRRGGSAEAAFAEFETTKVQLLLPIVAISDDEQILSSLLRGLPVSLRQRVALLPKAPEPKREGRCSALFKTGTSCLERQVSSMCVPHKSQVSRSLTS